MEVIAPACSSSILPFLRMRLPYTMIGAMQIGNSTSAMKVKRASRLSSEMTTTMAVAGCWIRSVPMKPRAVWTMRVSLFTRLMRLPLRFWWKKFNDCALMWAKTWRRMSARTFRLTQATW